MTQAAEERLAFAQKCEKMAKTQLEAAQNEVKEAKSFLNETHDKLQVSDLDEEVNTESGDGKRKSRVSPSPNIGNGKKARTEANLDLAAASLSSVVPASDTSSNSDDTVVEQIVVEGAGISAANGTYSKHCQSYDDCDSFFDNFFMDKNFPMWSKTALWEGVAAKFFISFSRWSKRCCLTCCKTNSSKGEFFYISERQDDNLPPKSDWSVSNQGISPSPRLKW